eukprot:CAMPEP_0118952784 /NCGR_PEP_ID=MMETSP1169-20130426/55443_1 /TAXON_ID=36882 /ORGANISM="Pyramimonas obovata, Strain CCMP722" /LENGTH=80 /DNA_ID=CAMNT_0006900111 /DNA_START=52 /DNA_END=291 /DNA_ORIENTATION=+
MTDYSDVSYWDQRYEESLQASSSEDRGPLFDWLCGYEDIASVLGDLQQSSRVLDLGCGNSELAEKLAQVYNLERTSPACV